MEISTSILNVEDNENTNKIFYDIESAGSDYIHIDVMDGIFVKQNTVLKMRKYADTISGIIKTPTEVHLMCQDVEQYIDVFAVTNPNKILFHVEIGNEEHIHKLIKQVKDEYINVGLVVNPETDIEEVYKYLPFIHTVLVMSVHPGKGGQQFIEETYEKIKKLKKYMDENSYDVEIEVDGGVNNINIKALKEAGAEVFVVGSYIIKSEDMNKTISELKSIIKE